MMVVVISAAIAMVAVITMVIMSPARPWGRYTTSGGEQGDGRQYTQDKFHLIPILFGSVLICWLVIGRKTDFVGISLRHPG
jgi:hypothetical protein